MHHTIRWVLEGRVLRGDHPHSGFGLLVESQAPAEMGEAMGMHLLEAPMPRTEHTYVLSAEAPLMVLCSHPLEVSQEQEGDQRGVRTTGSVLLLSGRKWHMSKTRWRAETQRQGCAPCAPVPALSPSWALPDRLMSQATTDSPLLWGWLHPQALLWC